MATTATTPTTVTAGISKGRTAASATKAAPLVARKLGKSFGPRVVLDGLDLTLGRAEVMAVMGPSGSGKSTLLNRPRPLFHRGTGG